MAYTNNINVNECGADMYLYNVRTLCALRISCMIIFLFLCNLLQTNKSRPMFSIYLSVYFAKQCAHTYVQTLFDGAPFLMRYTIFPSNSLCEAIFARNIPCAK